MSFAKKIKKYREENNLTQTEFAKMIGVSPRTLAHYEDGERYPRDVDVYRKIAEVMKCDYNYLIGSNEEFLSHIYREHGKKDVDKVRMHTEQISSLFAGGELSEDDKDIVFEMITKAY